MAWIRARVTYANVMASFALFVALGGVSYAAVSLPRGSVGTHQLRERAVTQGKLAPGSVGSQQIGLEAVRKRSLSPWILDQLSRRAAQGPPGPKGDPGPQGPGAVAIRYAQNASATPSFVTVLDVGGLSFRASCDDSGGTISLNFAARSAAAATLHETVMVDSGADLGALGALGVAGNLRINLPAGTALETGGPSAATGFTRVAIEAVYSAPGSTIELKMFTIVDADAGRCSIDGVAIPAS
jgi:hypothetical protein